MRQGFSDFPGFLHNFVTAKLATTSIGFKEILIFYHIVKIFKLPILISDLLFLLLLGEHAQVGVDQAVFKRYIVNPYAAGGYFGQYKMMQKTWIMSETLANRYSSESTQQGLSNEYKYDRV